MNKPLIAKRVSDVLVGITTAYFTTTIAKKVVTPDMQIAAKVGVFAGAVIINALVGELTCRTVHSQIDKISEKVNAA